MLQAAEAGARISPDGRTSGRADEVHHIKELREYPELALDDDNLVSLCAKCHNMRHGRIIKRFAKRKKRLTEEKW